MPLKHVNIVITLLHYYTITLLHLLANTRVFQRLQKVGKRVSRRFRTRNHNLGADICNTAHVLFEVHLKSHDTCDCHLALAFT